MEEGLRCWFWITIAFFVFLLLGILIDSVTKIEMEKIKQGSKPCPCENVKTVEHPDSMLLPLLPGAVPGTTIFEATPTPEVKN